MKTKNNTKIRLILLILSLVLVIGTCVQVYAGNGSSDSTVQAYEQQIADLKKKQQQALANLQAAQNDKTAATSEIQAIDEVIKYNGELLRLTEEQIATLESTIKTAKTNIRTLELKIDAKTTVMLDRMRQIYMSDDVDYLEMILGARGLGEFLAALDNITAILDYDVRLINELRQAKAELERENSRLEEQLETLNARKVDFEAAIEEQQALVDQKLEYIKSLENNEEMWLREYNYHSALEKQLNAELEEYLKKLWEQSQNQYVGGQIGWPLDKDVWYMVTSEFGWRDLYGTPDNHTGIDIAAYAGENVRAANAGTVVVSTEHWSYGEYIVIDHGGGYSTLYAHLALGERQVQVGDYVQAGQIIGYVGLTGNTYGYHLHFETRINGVPDNPRNYINFP
ncbi:MAG: peptidoglycan DD-metalloendopeptidase family protein [Clostridia bacterium]|nr:peptidoglycan DD-metalloendopeptidase family protein [Clostridia bacterium]